MNLVRLTIAGWMKLLLIGVVCCGSSSTGIAGTVVEARLRCLSVLIAPGGENVSFAFRRSEVGSTSRPNGEIGPLSPLQGPTSHGAKYILRPDETSEPIEGDLFLHLPAFRDDDANFFHDFFEVKSGVRNEASFGFFDEYQSTEGGLVLLPQPGAVTATWLRSPGSVAGTVLLDWAGVLVSGPTEHAFEVLEYVGTFDYELVDGQVVGELFVESPSEVTRIVEGRLEFSRLAEGSLRLEAAELLDELGDPLSVSDSMDSFLFGTTSFQSIFFDDGWLVTSEKDFLEWELSLVDGQDSDGDQIPDLFDSSNGVSENVRLTIQRAGARLQFRFVGSPGQVVTLQFTDDLNSGTWANVREVTLSSGEETLSLEPPTTTTGFWRAN